jgi:hypothetical protein
MVGFHPYIFFLSDDLFQIVLMEHAYFILKISGTKEAGPPGYLFLCPVKDLRTGPSSFRWSNSPAYWSLDPSGVDRLSAENATGLGFPSIQLMIKVKGDCWDASAYDGLREFHLAKGFDPYSQDVARHLGYPLYQISAEPEAPFAHGEPTVRQTLNIFSYIIK